MSGSTLASDQDLWPEVQLLRLDNAALRHEKEILYRNLADARQALALATDQAKAWAEAKREAEDGRLEALEQLARVRSTQAQLRRELEAAIRWLDQCITMAGTL